MANITRFTGGGDVIRATGQHFETVLVTESVYMNIRTASTAPVDTSSPNYDPNFATTLYYIQENP